MTMVRDSRRSNTNGSPPTRMTDGVAVSTPPAAMRHEAGGSMTPTTEPPQHQMVGSPSAIGNFFKRIRSRSKSPSFNLRKSPSQPGSYHVQDPVQDGPRRKSDTSGNGNPRTRPVRTSSRQRIKNWFTTSPGHKSNYSKNSAINTHALVTPSPPIHRDTTYYENNPRLLNAAAASHHQIDNPRSALSEEDLVSKSLVSELQTVATPIGVTEEGPDNKSSNVCGKSAAMTATPGGTLMASYYSQDSIFVQTPAADAAAAASSAVKTPSYIRISCALNGYGGLRNKPYRPSPQSTTSTAFRRGLVPSSTATANHNAINVPPTIMAKSIVERRLDKFQSPSKSSPGGGSADNVVVVTGKPPTGIPSSKPRSPTTTTTNADDNKPPQVSVRDRIEALSPSELPPQRDCAAINQQEQLEVDSNSSPQSNHTNQKSQSPVPAPRNGPTSTNQEYVNGDHDPPRTKVHKNNHPTVLEQSSNTAQIIENPVPSSKTTSSSSSPNETSLPEIEDYQRHQENDSNQVELALPAASTTETLSTSEFGDHPIPTTQSKHLDKKSGSSSEIAVDKNRKDATEERIMVNESDEESSDAPRPTNHKNTNRLQPNQKRMAPSSTNGISDSKLATEGPKLDAGGHKRRADDARGRLRALCHEADGYLQLDIPEEAGDLVRVAFGKANLLMGKKFNKFYDLIDKNRHPVEGDPEPILLDDLDGYWSIVAMEMDDVDRAFDIVRQMRSNDWTIPAPEKDKNPAVPINSNSNSPMNSRPGSRNSSAGGANAATKSANAQQRSNDARKRLAEAKALARKKKQVAAAAASASSPNGLQSSNDEIQIFGAIQ